MSIIDEISKVSSNLTWKEVEGFCRDNNYPIKRSKKGLKVRINNSIWCLHLEHGRRSGNVLKFGIVRELRRVLIKEKIITL